MVTEREAYAALLGEPVARVAALGGGDLSAPVLVTLASGRRAVVKAGPLVAVEGRMLRAMAAVGAPVPRVLAVAHGLLAIAYVDAAPGMTPAAWAHLGRALRAMHAAGGDAYGWDEDYAFGPVAIPNAPMDDWRAFWWTRRIAPLAGGRIGAGRRDALRARLDAVLPARPAAGLLHGDLWGGNVLAARDGGAVLIDPACYRGHGEVDLAMLTLFGTPPAAFWDAYGAPGAGWAERRAAYQLWPALVHRALFGAGYDRMVAGCLDRLGV